MAEPLVVRILVPEGVKVDVEMVREAVEKALDAEEPVEVPVAEEPPVVEETPAVEAPAEEPVVAEGEKVE